MNKYCNQHLLIGNEVEPIRNEIYENDRPGEPVAEARMSDQNYHHLTILKPSSNDENQDQFRKKVPKQQRVYSQV